MSKLIISAILLLLITQHISAWSWDPPDLITVPIPYFPVSCAPDAQLCPDGSSVSRDPDNYCQFTECPPCASDAQPCPDGSFVSRDPDNNCEFPECPPYCAIEVLSVDHGSETVGKYFNFDIDAIDTVLGRDDWNAKDFMIYNTRTSEITKVILWRDTNGGTIGDGHGREDDGTAQEGDFQIDDGIVFVDVDTFCQPSICALERALEVLSVDHGSGSVAKYFNFDIDIVDSVLGRDNWHGETFMIYNSRTSHLTKVKMWRSINGGTIGDGHGREDDGTAKEGDFQIGDEIAFVGINTFCQPSICAMEVLSIDHISGTQGIYFNFDIDVIDSVLGRNNWHGENFMIYNSRTSHIIKVKMWRSVNGGSLGDGHGREDDGTAHEGDFQIGDEFMFVDINTFCQPSRCPLEVLSVDHGSETVGKYFNFDINVIDSVLGRNNWSGETFMIYNSRTSHIIKVKMWRSINGGTIGDGHGREDDGTAEEGDFQIGDEITILNMEQEYIECLRIPIEESVRSITVNDDGSSNDNNNGNNNDLFCGTNDDKPLWTALLSLNQDLLNALIELKGDDTLQGIFEYIQCSEFVYYAVSKASVPGPLQSLEFTNNILGLLQNIPGIGDIIGDSVDEISQFIVNLFDELTPDDIGLHWGDYYEQNGKIFNPFKVLEPLAQFLSVKICDVLVTGQNLNVMLETLRDSESIIQLRQSFNDNIYGFLNDDSNNVLADTLKTELLTNDFYKEFTFVMTIGMQLCFSKLMTGCVTRMHGIATNLKGETKIIDSRSMYIECPTMEYGISSSGFVHFDFMSNLNSIIDNELSLSVGVSTQTPGSETLSNYKDQWDTHSDRAARIPFIGDGPSITVDFINGNIEDNSLIVDIITGGANARLLVLYSISNNMNCNGFRIDLTVGEYDAFGGSILFGYEYRKENTGSVKQNLKWIDDVELPNYQDIAHIMISMSADAINVFPDAMNSVTDFVGDLGDQILQESMNSVKNVLNGVIDIVEDIANVGVDAANGVVLGTNVLIDGANEAIEEVVDVAEDAFNGVISAANTAIDAANTVANTANDAIDDVTGIYDDVSTAVNAAKNECEGIDDNCIDFEVCILGTCVGINKCIRDIIEVDPLCNTIFLPITEADNLLKSAIDDLPNIPTIPRIDSVNIGKVVDIPDIPTIPDIEIANIAAKKDNAFVKVDSDNHGDNKDIADKISNNHIQLPTVYIKLPPRFYVFCVMQAVGFILIGFLIDRYCFEHREYKKIVNYVDTDTEQEHI